MPLESGKSKEAFSHNVEVEMNAGKPQKQAVAIAYSKQREAKDMDVDCGDVELEENDSVEVELAEAIEAGKKEAEHQKQALKEAVAADQAPRMIAMDRAPSMRTKDVDGRLHVRDCNVSKANVCPYIGHEIPDWQQLGLEADRIYYLYRDAAALAEAAKTMERVPLMMRHVASTAARPQKETIVGTVSNVRWIAPYLRGDLTVWDAVAIEAVESQRQCELSPGYRYTPVMESGVSPEGERYDGRMMGPIIFNHLALVDTGRTGPDVVVNDSAAG